MIALYGMDCRPFLEKGRLQAAMPRLDSQRQGRVQRLLVPEKKAQCAAAGVLITHLFGGNGTPPLLSHARHGKPFLTQHDERFFNLSHTGHYVFCAVSDRDIGLDAQEVSPYRPAIAQRHFTHNEQAWLEASDDPDRDFIRLWTMKEAYLKQIGFGMVLPMSSFDLPLPPVSGADEGNRCRWALTSYSAQSEILLSLCGQGVDRIPDIQWIPAE